MISLDAVDCRVEEGGQFQLFLNANDDTEYAASFREKWWLETSLNFILKYFPRGSKLIDLGANVGVFSLPAAAAGLQCLSIEAFPHNFLTLHHAVRINGFKNIRLVNVAVSDEPGVISMGLWGAYARVNPDGSGIQVPALRGDDVIELEGFGDADIVKADIEGSELKAFKGMSTFFDKNTKVSILYESNPDACVRLGYDFREVMKLFERRGFDLYFVRAERIYPISSDGIQPWAVADVYATRQPVKEVPP